MGITATIYACKPGTHEVGPMLEVLDLDKYWHGLHYLLCGSNERNTEISSFILRGTEIAGASDAEVFLHEPAEVECFNGWLKNKTIENLRAQYNVKQMAKMSIYGNFEENESDLNSLLEKFGELKEFVNVHAKNGNELLVVIC